LGTQNFRVHTHDQHLFVVRAIEDPDAAALGQAGAAAPQKVVVELLFAGVLEAETWQPCGLTPDITCLIAPSLPAASMAWKISSSA